MIPLRCAAVAAAMFAALSASALAAPTTLRASHQFPGGRGDVRDEMVQIIARDAKAANVDLEIQVYPGASLFKPNEQWNALVNGQLDISSFPLDYASGKVRAFGATLMPGLVRSHERAQRLNNSPFMKEIKAHIDKAGVVVLADAWLAGAIASKKGCIRRPEDIKGLKVRSAGPTFASMWQSAGASIVSIPSNEVYNALQTGVADATDTSSGSFVSFRIYEQVKCLTAPGDNALWFMYEPVLMSKKSFSRLNKKQQDVVLQAGKKSQQFFADKAKGLDDEMVKVFKDHNVEVVTLTPQEYDAWLKVAETFVGSPYLLLTRGHVNVDVLPLYLGARARWWLALASILMSLGFALVLAVLTSRLWLEAWEQRWVSDTMWRARLWIPYSAMPIGLGILTLQYIADLYNLLAGREPPFGIKA